MSKKILTETEIRALERGLSLTPAPNVINEENLRREFDDFNRKMRCNWYFRNGPSKNVGSIPAFKLKSFWKPPASHPGVELCLSKLEGELFSFLTVRSQSYNLSKEEWQTVRNLAEDHLIIIKPDDKGS